jgi:hypothetical protein
MQTYEAKYETLGLIRWRVSDTVLITACVREATRDCSAFVCAGSCCLYDLGNVHSV